MNGHTATGVSRSVGRGVAQLGGDPDRGVAQLGGYRDRGVARLRYA